MQQPPTTCFKARSSRTLSTQQHRSKRTERAAQMMNVLGPEQLLSTLETVLFKRRIMFREAQIVTLTVKSRLINTNQQFLHHL